MSVPRAHQAWDEISPRRGGPSTRIGIRSDAPAGDRAPWMMIAFLTVLFVAATVGPPDHFPWMVVPETMLANHIAGAEQGMITRQIALPVLGLVSIIGLLRGHRAPLRAHNIRAILLIIVFTLGVASLWWADDPALVSRKLAVRLLLWLGVIWVAQQLERGDLTKLALYAPGVTVLLGVAAEVGFGVFKPWTADYRLMGLVHPNQTGEQAGIAALAAMSLAMQAGRRRSVYVALAVIAMGLLLLTRSRTALLATIVAMAFLLVVVALRQTRIRWLLICTGAALVLALCLWQLFATTELSRVTTTFLSSGRDDSNLGTLSERTPLWAELISRYVTARPWLGYGFDGFWTTKHLVQMSLLHRGLVYYHSHSDYIEMALSIGIPGAIAFTLAIISTVTAAVRRYARLAVMDDAFAAAAMVYLLTAMLAEIPNFSIGITAFLFAVVLARYCFMDPPDAVVHAPASRSGRVRHPMLVARPAPRRPVIDGSP